MRNIFLLFAYDMKRITMNVVTGIIIMGLVFLPFLFNAYNILACWDVFDNTGNLKVAVANDDAGYKSDLIPIQINIGEEVESALRANTQIDWVFTDEDDAVEGAKSGEYYAAVVIPESFSADMMSFYSDDSQHAQIVFYNNEKRNAIAPRVTDQASSRVAYQVNVAFTDAITNAGLAIVESLANYADEADLSGTIGSLSTHIGQLGTQMNEASDTLRAYSNILDSSQKLVGGTSELLSNAQGYGDQLSDQASSGKDSVGSIASSMDATTQALKAALDKSASSYDGVQSAVDDAFDSTGQTSSQVASTLRQLARDMDQPIGDYTSLKNSVDDLHRTIADDGAISDEHDQVVNGLGQLSISVQAMIDREEDLQAQLNQGADDIESGNKTAQQARDDINQKIADAKAGTSDMDEKYQSDIAPTLDTLESQVSQIADQLSSSAGDLDSATDGIVGSTGSTVSDLQDAQQKIDAMADELSASAEKLTSASDALNKALSTGDTQALKDALGSNTEALASAISAPVQVNRIAVFPADNFGSQMAPLYSTLAIWIGSLLLVVAIKVEVSPAQRSELLNPKPYQLYLGRFGVFAFVSLCQTSVMGLGNLLFLGVQAENPLLYMICYWVSGLVFTFMMYTFVVSFANLGKAIGVLFLILQVTAAGGSYPLQVLPEFFQVISPFIPATHTINAMRAAMMGVYANDFWISIGYLLLFVLPMLVLGLVLRRPFDKFVHWYVKKAEESRIIQ